MDHTVDAVMTTQVVTARPSTPFHELARLLEHHRISALPVIDDPGRLVGIVSEADLLVKEGPPTAPPTPTGPTCSATGSGSARPPAPAPPSWWPRR